jgi:hypothetical protein
MLGRHQSYDKSKTDLSWQAEVLNGLYNELKLTSEDKGNLFEDELVIDEVEKGENEGSFGQLQ